MLRFTIRIVLWLTVVVPLGQPLLPAEDLLDQGLKCNGNDLIVGGMVAGRFSQVVQFAKWLVICLISASGWGAWATGLVPMD